MVKERSPNKKGTVKEEILRCQEGRMSAVNKNMGKYNWLMLPS